MGKGREEAELAVIAAAPQERVIPSGHGLALLGWHHGAETHQGPVGLVCPEHLLLGPAQGGHGGVCGVCVSPASQNLQQG